MASQSYSPSYSPQYCSNLTEMEHPHHSLPQKIVAPVHTGCPSSPMYPTEEMRRYASRWMELTKDQVVIADFVHTFVDKAKRSKKKGRKWQLSYRLVARAVWKLLVNMVVTLPTAPKKKKHYSFRELSTMLARGEGSDPDYMRYYMAAPAKTHLVTVRAALGKAGFTLEEWSEAYEQQYAEQVKTNAIYN